MKLKLVEPTRAHEGEASKFIAEFEEGQGISGTSGLEVHDYFPAWLKKLEVAKTQPATHYDVPHLTLFMVQGEADNERIVGSCNINLELNQELWGNECHIGLCIRPTERGQKYSEVLLYLALMVCQNHKMEAVLLACDADNTASAHAIRALGGKSLGEHGDQKTGRKIQNYVILVDEAIERYCLQYESYIAEKPNF